MTQPAKRDWAELEARAENACRLARLLQAEGADLGDDVPGAGTKLRRRLGLVVETFERVAEEAARYLRLEQERQEREAKATELRAARQRMRQEIRDGRR